MTFEKISYKHQTLHNLTLIMYTWMDMIKFRIHNKIWEGERFKFVKVLKNVKIIGFLTFSGTF